MTRIFSSPGDEDLPRIEKDDVARFFRARAQKIPVVGSVRAVIYQDKHPDLAEKRDAAEKAIMLPLLQLDGTQRLLDVGCGTGRWTAPLIDGCEHYHGLDFSAELIEYARSAHPETGDLRFSVAPAEDYSLSTLGESLPFDRILCCGVMIYLNDEDVLGAFRCMVEAASPKARIVLREPIGIKSRLTIKAHFSEELEQTYNAIYRTRDELEKLMAESLLAAGFVLVSHGYVYDAKLSNRKETTQHWFLLERT